jgi:hypothetical protein
MRGYGSPKAHPARATPPAAIPAPGARGPLGAGPAGGRPQADSVWIEGLQQGYMVKC